MKSKKTYVVSVGNVGNMEYTSKKLAMECYTTYVTHSKNNETRAAGEPVMLYELESNNIIAEYAGTIDLENED